MEKTEKALLRAFLFNSAFSINNGEECQPASRLLANSSSFIGRVALDYGLPPT